VGLKGREMTKKTEKVNGYDRVTQTILDALDAGTVPWRRPWIASGYVAKSLTSKKNYRGVNQFLLALTADANGYTSPWWGTYKQITSLGGQVRKGEKGTYVIYFTIIEKEDAEGNLKKIPFLRGFTVFNSEQADWEEGKAPKWDAPVLPDVVEVEAAAEAVVKRYLADGGPSLAYGGDRAFYRPSEDHVQIPPIESFTGTSEYYSTLFHELGHSTGAETRLNRKTLTDASYFGAPNYCKEELVAEFTAAFLCGNVGVLPGSVDNSAAYIDGWRKALKDDPKAVVWAASQAQKAADLILGITPEVEVEADEKVAVSA
jgi:antirestriction protein ArdC